MTDMRRLAVSLAVSAMVLGSCTGETARSERPLAMKFSSQVPWAIQVPVFWRVSTIRTEPDPRLMTGLLRTYVASVPYPFGLGEQHPGPNAGGGASIKLGDSAVVVFVQLLWYPPDEAIRWDPPAGARLRQTRITRWHRDAQNIGWRFRERKLCLERACVSVLEWYGPAASELAVTRAEEIASSVRLKSDWTDD